MAKFSLLTTIVLDSAGYTKGINQVTQATKEMGNKMTEAGAGVKEIFSGLGGELGAVTEGISSLVGAATGIGLIVAAVKLFTDAIAEAKAEMEAYQKVGEKLKYGQAGFEVESNKARKETAEALRGQITAGNQLIGIAAEELYTTTRLNGEKIVLTEESRKYYQEMQTSGKKMRDDAMALLDATGEYDKMVGKTSYNITKQWEWNKKRNGLAAELNKIQKENVTTEAEILSNDAKIYEIRAKMYAETDPTEKQKLQIEYEKISLDTYNKRINFLDQEKLIKEQLLTMEGRTEELDNYSLGIAKQKAEAEVKYEQKMAKSAQMQLKVNTAEGKDLKEQQKTEEDLQKFKNDAITNSMSGQLKEQTMIDQKYAIDIKGAKDNAELKDAITEEYISHSLAVQKKYDDEAVKEAKDTADKIFEEKKKAEEKSIEDQKKAKENQLSLNKEILGVKISILNDEYDAGLMSKQEYLQKMMDLELQNEELTGQQKVAIRQKYTAMMAQADLESISFYGTKFSEILGSIGQMQQASKASEIKAAGKNALAKEQIERQYARKAQRIAIAQAIINTALAVGSALQTKPFLPVGLIMAAAAGLAGAAQVSTIMGQSFAKGGIVSGPTNALIGEYRGASTNPEVVAPLSKLQELLGLGGGGSNVKFEIQGDTLVGVLNNYERKIKSYA